MEPLTVLSRKELRDIGLNNNQINIFRELRQQVGEITPEVLESDDNVPDAMRRKLIAWLETSNADLMPGKLERLELSILPTPLRSGSVATLEITFNSAIDGDLEVFSQTLHLRGPSRIKLFDVSHEHLVEIRVKSSNNDSGEEQELMSRTATPGMGGTFYRSAAGGGEARLVFAEQPGSGSPAEIRRMEGLTSSDGDEGPVTFDPSQPFANEDFIRELARRREGRENPQLEGSEYISGWEFDPALGKRDAWKVDEAESKIVAIMTVGTFLEVDATPFAPLPETRFTRSGKYRILGEPDARFDHFELSFTPVLSENAEVTLQSMGLTAEMAGMAKFENSDPLAAQALTRLALQTGALDFEGSFELNSTIFTQTDRSQPEFAGWAWALTGPVTIIGFQPDANLLRPKSDVVIVLPSLGKDAEADGLPHDVSEAAMLARPDLFGDDPGSNCRPFENPSRTLGEKRFSTILRVTQPYVAGARGKPIFPDIDGARPVEYPRSAVAIGNPVDFENEGMTHQARSVAIGHILEHAVRYRSNGYSLGDVAYSLTLAPRQKRRIMKLDYERQERSSRDEQTFMEDEVADSLDRVRDYDNAVESELDEWSQGSSRAKMKAGAAGLGFAAGPVILGGGAVSSSASSSSQQSGGRSAAAAETQRLRDSIRRFGQSLRNFGSTVISETEQSESVEAVSEIVQNINYTRSLSVIYYEILRHIRVDTEISGVRECVFVPLPVKPFDDHRIVKYAHLLRRYTRGWDQRFALRHAREAAFGFPHNHEVPSGERQTQTLENVTGTVYLQMGIALPEDGEEVAEIDKNTDRTVYEREIYRARVSRWAPFQGFMPVPLPLLVEKTINASAEERNRYFQSEIAPHMARRYLNELKVETKSGTQLEADFTLVGNYRFGQTVRVDFTVPSKELTRQSLTDLVFSFGNSVAFPPKSFVNLTQCIVRYSNSYYRGSVRSDSGYRDLVNSETGKPDAQGAKVHHSPTSADKRDLREVARLGFRQFAERVTQKQFFFNKVLWWNIDPDELYTLLDGFAVSSSDGRSLASMVQRRPLGIMGNMMVFQTNTDRPVDPMFESFDDLKAHYLSGLAKSDPMRISLPTRGVYARAHLDGCVAAEEHNGSFDWVFDNQEPALADFPSNMFESRRSAPQDMQPSDMPETIINLQNAPAAPAVSGLSDAFGAVQNAGVFRDMAGLAGTQANAKAAMQAATSLAGSFGNMVFQQRMAQIAADAAAAKDVRAATSAVNHAVETGAVDKKTAEKTLGDYMARRLGGDTASNVAKNAKELANKVLDLPSGGSITTTTEDGTQTVTRNGGDEETEGQADRPLFAGEGAVEGITDERSTWQVEQYLKIHEVNEFSDLLDSEKIHKLGLFAPFTDEEIAHHFPDNEEIDGTTPADQRKRARDRGFSFQTELATNRSAVVLSSSGGDDAQRVTPLNYLVYDFPVNGSDLFGDVAEAFLRFLSRRAEKLKQKDVTVKFSVVGRSDSAGKEKDNENLRKDRAENSWNRIATFGGLDSLDTTTQTLKPNTTEFGRACNRSVTIQEHFTKPPLNRPTFPRGKAQREDILTLALSMAKEEADKVPADGRGEPENRRTLAIDRILRRYAENSFAETRYISLKRFDQFWHKDFEARVITPTTITKSNIVEDLNDMIRLRLDYDTRDNLMTMGAENAEQYARINEQIAIDLLDSIGDEFESGWKAQTLVGERARQDLNPPAITGSGGTGPRWDVFRLMADMLEESSSMYKVTIDLKPD